jgi:hemerythrin
MRHNVFIVWKPEYNLGIPIIDEQHRGIVTIINSLYYGMQHNYVNSIIVPIIDMMHDYTQIHFQIEVDLLEKNYFPDIKSHHVLHQKLLTKLNEVGRKTMLDKDPYQFMGFLKEWWINHICKEDMAFRNYYTNQD